MTFPDETPEWVYLLRANANNLADIVSTACSTLDRIETTTTHMEQEPMYDAKEYWREGKYLTLIFPQVNNYRKRIYIGADDDKIREAKRAIDRHKRHEQYMGDLFAYQRKCHDAANLIDRAVRLLKDKPTGW